MDNCIREVDVKLLESLLLKEQIVDYNKAVLIINNNWAKNLGFTLKMRRPPKWNYVGMATLRIYCGKSTENCQFGITLRIEPESFWILGETYDPFKMGHTHELILTP